MLLKEKCYINKVRFDLIGRFSSNKQIFAIGLRKKRTRILNLKEF